MQEEVANFLRMLFTKWASAAKMKSPVSQVRRLPVGDAIWIARNKFIGTEYVLDFIVERKNVEDLQSSIRDNRYRDQKLRLLRCGLKKLIYVIEGDPNACAATESIKTACFTTEILEGFDVQRTSGLGETLRKYGYLTQAINQYHRCMDSELPNSRLCPRFKEFIRKCEDLDKMTVSDVFAVQLMQVPQVTEEAAIAVLDVYPTLSSLARAYSLLDGDVRAQEEMLKEQSNNLVNSVASKNIFHLKLWSFCCWVCISEGMPIPSIGFEAKYLRMRYASLLRKYGLWKAKEDYVSENEDPPRPRPKTHPLPDERAIASFE
ncbi:Crossover junction endonuclease MUS81 [Capsicum annuum]|nr:Crossover junction endonuclease MUS81 [Capsicum annuum]